MEYPYDYSHLNYEGHKMAMPYFEAAMSKCYADFIAGKYEEKALPPEADVREGTAVSGVTWENKFFGGPGVGSEQWQLVGSSVYKTSSIITVPKAGTMVYFAESVKNIGTVTKFGELGDFASNGAYVFSSWISDTEVDKSGTNLDGSQATHFMENGKLVWVYITQKDNEKLRICYRCEVDTENPVIMLAEPKEPELPTPSEAEWHRGFIGSDLMSGGQDWLEVPSVDPFRYTDVFVVEKAGTTISFKDYGDETHKNVFIFSTRKYDFAKQKWVIDKEGVNLRNIVSGETMDSRLVKTTGSDGCTVYSYTTSSANEKLRICIKGGDDPAVVEITVKEPTA